jgi:hypothetical protein
MADRHENKDLKNLPACVGEFIRQVVKKMRYRKKVRKDVQDELTVHFEDELQGCKTDEDRRAKAQQLITDFGDVKLLAVLLRRAKKRCRPLWRTVIARTFQVMGVLILCFVLYIFWFFSGKPAITTNYVAELNRIAKPAVDESLNAAPFYDKAVKLGVEEPEEKLGSPLALADWPAHLTAEQMASVKRWIKANEACFQQIRLGSERPYYWQRYQSKSGNMLSVPVPSAEYRRIARLIVLRAKIRAYHGQVKDAFDDILMCYRFGMHQRVPTSLIEQLVGMNIERMAVDTARVVLDKVNVERETLTDFQQSFEKLLEKNIFTLQFDGERLGLYDEIQRSFTDGLGDGHIIPKHIKELYPMVQVIGLSANTETVSSAESQKPSWFSKFMSNVRHGIYEAGGFIKKSAYILFLHPDKQQTYQAAEELYDLFESLTVKTPGQIGIEKIDTEKETMEIIKGNILLEMLVPAVVRVNELSHRNKTDSQALLTILAILRYKNGKGFYPGNLQELITTGYLKELPNDPYRDRPLIYRRTDDSFVLYSVGPNFTDEGGEPGKDSKGRVRNWRDNGDTVFWPVLKPDAER